MRLKDILLIIPDYDEEQPETYPGGIKPGAYDTNEVVTILRENAYNPEAIRFIADMLEE